MRKKDLIKDNRNKRALVCIMRNLSSTAMSFYDSSSSLGAEATYLALDKTARLECLCKPPLLKPNQADAASTAKATHPQFSLFLEITSSEQGGRGAAL
jgi:hypothetical protein